MIHVLTARRKEGLDDDPAQTRDRRADECLFHELGAPHHVHDGGGRQSPEGEDRRDRVDDAERARHGGVEAGCRQGQRQRHLQGGRARFARCKEKHGRGEALDHPGQFVLFDSGLHGIWVWVAAGEPISVPRVKATADIEPLAGVVRAQI